MPGQRIGHIRVGSVDQNSERQLEQVPLDRAFTDQAFGKDVHRPQLEAPPDFARDGDTVLTQYGSTGPQSRRRRMVNNLTHKGSRLEFVREHLTFSGSD